MSRSPLVRSSFLLLLALGACGDDSGTATLTPPTETNAATTAAEIQPAVEGDPMKVSIHTLDNGLTVMLSENHETPRVYAMITTRAGSAKDPAEATGMAHYLEHMLFKGTTKLGTTDWEKERPHIEAITRLYDERFATTDPEKRADLYRQIDAENKLASQYACANELDQLYDLWGFQGLNAFTNHDQTSYVADVPANRLEHWARAEVERYTDPVFRLFQSELEAVYEEKNQGMDSEQRSLYQTAMLAAFPEHPYGTQSTIGKVEHLKNPSLTKMRAYFDKWYVPGNMVVVLAGDFESKEALAIVEKHLGKLPAKPVPPDPVREVAVTKGVKRVELTHKGDPQVMLMWHTVPVGHPDRDALVLCDMMLDNQQTGLINVNLTQAQRVRGAGSSPQFMNEAGLQRMWAIPKGDQTLEECESLLHEQMAKLKAGELTADIAAVITDFEVSQKRQREENQTRARTMTTSFVERVSWADQVAELDRLRKVTKEHVVAAANKYFGDDYVVVTKKSGTPEYPKVEKPNFTPVNIEEQHSAFFDEMAALPSEPIAPKFAKRGEDYTVKEYPWGRLYWVENPANDLFSITFNFEVGTDHDKNLELALPLLDLGGAGDLDPVAYKRKLYALGTTASAGAGASESVVSIEGLDANFEASVDLVRAHFAQPTGVGQEQLSQMVQQAVTGRNFQKQNPRAINGALVNFAMRGVFSPYLDTPTNDELMALKAEDVLGAAQSLWGYKRIVTYAGPRSVDEVAAAIEPKETAEPGLLESPGRMPLLYIQSGRNRVLYVNAPGAQAQVGLLSPDGFFKPKAYPAGRVYNEYMSGSMGSVVFQEVRESRSLAYSAWTNYRTPNFKGDQNMMMGMLTCQTDKTVEAVEVLLGLIRKMPAEEERIDRVRKAVDQQYRTSRMTYRRLPGAALTWDRWGVGEDPRQYNWETASKMTLEDLEKFAARFEDVPFTITITGDVSRIDMEALKKFGEVEEMQPDELFAW